MTRPDGSEKSPTGDAGALIGRILFAMVWMPIQIAVSLFFATGGLMLLLLLGILLAVLLGPFVGLFMLVRSLVRRRTASER